MTSTANQLDPLEPFNRLYDTASIRGLTLGLRVSDNVRTGRWGAYRDVSAITIEPVAGRRLVEVIDPARGGLQGAASGLLARLPKPGAAT